MNSIDDTKVAPHTFKRSVKTPFCGVGSKIYTEVDNEQPERER